MQEDLLKGMHDPLFLEEHANTSKIDSPFLNDHAGTQFSDSDRTLDMLVLGSKSNKFHCTSDGWGQVNWFLCTQSTIFQLYYVTAHSYAAGLKKEVGPMVGLPRHIHFVWLCPSEHRHGVILFTVIPRNRTHSIVQWDSINNIKTIFRP